mmetsp:Transcript_12676/g.35669  ORF Transcript_12676/g.35669 Transcript_12676/m.35669 type:complete len:351 (+) Transcript_12676:105-1157(+)|eukprot:CAMPEP_0117680194 /NCGR_PEP_ID=MMETSP0804-20121206/18214_1 /TAXON_ID=1074897 /ORGANISM="Tetraselmis astigmatica, Strain CCMP880" /LENGTH=350 /DNA_ID=CAMNT_0005489659 /DNA_START=71 /DNA_END=1123 /DNA_ORIENTATION=+
MPHETGNRGLAAGLLLAALLPLSCIQGIELKTCANHPDAPGRDPGRHLLEKSVPPDTFITPDLTPEFLDALTGAWNATLSEWSCPISTAECGYQTSLRHTRGSLGSCAVVGLGAGLRNHKYGADIDGHDTIVRMGYVPITKFADMVGSRTDVMFLKLPRRFEGASIDRDRYSTLKPEHIPSKFYLVWPYSCTTGTHGGKDVLLAQMLPPGSYMGCETGFVSQQPWTAENNARMESKLFQSIGNRFIALLQKYRKRNYVLRGKDPKSRKKEEYLKQIHLTTGFSLIASLLSSGMCTSMDVYGFSSVPSFKYFSEEDSYRNHLPRPGHVLGLENYLLKVAQHMGLLCIYADK